jgi:hypothetical protein
MRSSFLLLPLAAITLATAGTAQIVDVRLTGQVEYNQISSGPLGQVSSGQPVEVTFQFDASNFVNSPSFPTRGYPISNSSFVMTLGTTTVGLQSPFPVGQTPYFALRNNDPAVDGFFISTVVDFPVGVPLNVPSGTSNFRFDFLVTYGGSTLSSLNVEDAAGTYDFTGLSVFNMTIDSGPFQPLGMTFEKLEITPQVQCGFTPYGVGATPVNALELRGIGSPAVGGSVNLSVANVTQPVMLASLSTGSANLPLFGGALLVDPFGQFLFQPMTIAAGKATIAVPVPPNPAFAGLTFYAQAGGPDGAQPEGIVLTGGLAITICP